jgi:hypothetical protein
MHLQQRLLLGVFFDPQLAMAATGHHAERLGHGAIPWFIEGATAIVSADQSVAA